MSNDITLKNLYIAIRDRNLSQVKTYINDLKSSPNNLIFKDCDDDANGKTPLQYACYLYYLKDDISNIEFDIYEVLLTTQNKENINEDKADERFVQQQFKKYWDKNKQPSIRISNLEKEYSEMIKRSNTSSTSIITPIAYGILQQDVEIQ